jgi:HD-GYP domain-containing protein (c-di-GMP phosphodiesterase class II)
VKPAIPDDPGIEMAIRLRLACEAHDPTIGSHLDRVSYYACEIGRLMGLSRERIKELHYATPLHDMGKIGMSLELLHKPDHLAPEEMEAIRAHTTIGRRILENSPWPVIRCAAEIALSHHECWDGTGYPHELSGKNIPLDARIVAVADVYDALLSQRTYKPAWEEERVIAEMRRLRGTKFDPEILDLFLEHLPSIVASATSAPF